MEYTTEQLNSRLQVKSLGGLVFSTGEYSKRKAVVCRYYPNAFGLFVKGLGWLSFKHDGCLPYSPIGGKEALLEVQATGLINYNDIHWVKPIKL